MKSGPWELLERKTDWRGVTLHRARHLDTGEEYLLEDLALATPAKERLYRDIVLGLEERITQAKPVNHSSLRKPVGVTRHQEGYLIVRPADRALWESWGPEPSPGNPEELGRWLTVMAGVIAAYHQAGLAARGPARSDLVPAGGSVLVLEPLCESYLAGYRDKELYQRFEKAPEIVKGKPWDNRSDIFLFGVHAYHLAAGRFPFSGSEAVLVDNLLSEKVLNPRIHQPSLGPALAGTILSLLERDPGKRPDAPALLATLESQGKAGKWAATEHEREEGSGRRRARIMAKRERFLGFLRRNRVAVGVGCALVVIFVAMIVFFRGTPSVPVITSETTPQQVVDAYYRAIQTLNPDLLDETLAPGVGKNTKNMVTNLFVIDKTRQAYAMEANQPGANDKQIWFENMDLSQTGQDPPEFTARYVLALNQGDKDQLTDVEEHLTLGRIEDKRVGEKWAIVALDQRQLSVSERPHPEDASSGGTDLLP